MLIGGFFLGVGGTAFAVGVPFVNAWFPPERRGLAIGVFGAGMGGTAISALTTVRLVDASNVATPFVVTAVVLALCNSHLAGLKRPAAAATTIHYGLGDVESWREDGRRIILTADAWRTV